MRSQFVTIAALAGSAYAGLEAYGPPTYGSETSSPSAPAYESSSTPSAPEYGSSSAPSAPQYGASSSSTSKIPSATAPAYAPSVTPSSPESPATVTDVVSVFTTYCPEATTFTHQGSTYSITSATTLTLSISVPTYAPSVSSPATSVPTYAPSVSPSTPGSPAVPTAPGYGSSSSLASVPSYAPSVVPSTSGSPVVPTAPIYSSGPVPQSTLATIPSYAPSASSPVSPVQPSAPYGYGNATTPAGTGVPSASSTYPAQYTGAASQLAGSALVGAVGIFGAFFL